MSHLDRFHNHLSLNRLYRTRQRDTFYEAVAANQPATLAELQVVLAGQLSASSVYRLVHEMKQADVISQSQAGLISLSDRFAQHHHTLICRSCGRQSRFWNETIEKSLMRYAAKSNFQVEEHHLELTGLCFDCRPHRRPRSAIDTNLRRAPERLNALQ